MSSQDPYAAPSQHDRDAASSGRTYGGSAQYGFTPYDGYSPAGSPSMSPLSPMSSSGPIRATRPGTLTAGAVLSWLGGVFLVLIGALMLIVAAAGEFRANASDDSDDTTTVMVVATVVVALGVAIVALGSFAFMGRLWAAIMLTVIGAVIGLLFLAGGLVALATADGVTGIGLFIAVYIGLAVGLLWGSAAMRFYRSRRGGPDVYAPGSYPGGSYPFGGH